MKSSSFALVLALCAPLAAAQATPPADADRAPALDQIPDDAEALYELASSRWVVATRMNLAVRLPQGWLRQSAAEHAASVAQSGAQGRALVDRLGRQFRSSQRVVLAASDPRTTAGVVPTLTIESRPGVRGPQSATAVCGTLLTGLRPQLPDVALVSATEPRVGALAAIRCKARYTMQVHGTALPIEAETLLVMHPSQSLQLSYAGGAPLASSVLDDLVGSATPVTAAAPATAPAAPAASAAPAAQAVPAPAGRAPARR